MTQNSDFPQSSGNRYLLGSLLAHPETIALIGEFVVRWSLAESSLLLPLLVAMQSTSQQVAASILSSTNSTEGKIKLVKAAIDNMPHVDQHQAPMKSVLKKFQALCEERNIICHHAWGYDEWEQSVVTVDFRKPSGNEKRITKQPNTYLKDLCNRTLDLAVEISTASGSSWVTAEGVSKFRL